MKFLIVLVALALAANADEFNLDTVCNDQLLLFGRHPDDCQRYFMCMLNQRVDFVCEENFIFDEERRRCRLGSRDTCQFRFGPEPPCDDTLLLFHHREDTCVDFFMCMLSQRVDFSCEWGQIFDIDTRRCVRGDHRLCQPIV